MRAAPIRFFNAALWPLTIWMSLTHLDEHPADDYVERTSPIVATAIGFWVTIGALVAMQLYGYRVVEIVSDNEVARVFLRGPDAAVGVIAFIAPVLYVIGFWLFTARDERFPR